MSLKLKFDLQFFGGGGMKTQQISKRNPEPEELTNLRMGLYNKIYPGLQSFDEKSWQQAQDITNKALQQQNTLMSQLPDYLDRSSGITDKIMSMAETGNIPTGVMDRLNAVTNQELQSGMGSMLNGLSNRGVLNSSIASKGINNLSKTAADAYNRNYLTAYQTALGAYGNALQGAQNNTQSLLAVVNALGTMPSQAYEGAYAGLMPTFNLWKNWQSSYDNREDYDTIAYQKPQSCITGDTLITLSNGKPIPVSELHDCDTIKAWDFNEGCVVSAPLTAFFKRIFDEGLDVFRVVFEDGSNVGVIFEHLFFDLTLGKFVAVNAESNNFIGHEFAKVNAEGEVTPVKVKDIITGEKTTETYAPQCKGYLNFLTDGFISGNDGQLGLCNMFEFDKWHMTYNKRKRMNDLLKYGKLEYDDFKEIMSKEFFEANHIDEWGVSVGKGLMTFGELKSYLAKFAHCFLK